MGIVQRIQERYAVEEILPFAGQINSFSLVFDSSVSADEQYGIRRGITDLALREDALDVDLCLQFTNEGDDLVLTVNEKNSFRFPEQNSRICAVIWTVYGLATGASWVSMLSGKTIRADAYSSDQQILAAALLKAALQWQSGRPNIQSDLTQAVERGTVDLIREGPRLSMQPVIADAWRDFDYSLLPKKHVMTGQELMRTLYGTSRFTNTIDAYCRFIQSSDTYKQVLQEMTGRLLHKMHRQPIAGLRNALHSAAQELFDQYEEDLIDNPRMESQLTISKFTPENLTILLSGLDKLYEKDMAARVRKCFLQSLLRSCANALQREIQEAKTAVQNLHFELRNFCAVAIFNRLQPELPPDFPPDLPVLDFGWDQSIHVQDKALQVPHTVWDDAMLYRLQMTGSLGQNIWLASPALANKSDAGFASCTFGIPHLSEQLVIGLRTE